MMREKEDKEKKKRRIEDHTRGRPKSKKEVVPDSSDEEEEEANAQALVDDSSEYTDEVEEREPEEPSPFLDRQAAVGDYVLVELALEEGRNAGQKIHYVAKALGVENDKLEVSYMRLSGKYGINDTFYYPNIEDTGHVDREKVLGFFANLRRARPKDLHTL